MRALVFSGPNDAAVMEVDSPAIGPDDALIRSHAVGICHSDFELLEGRYIIPFAYPIIPGHEWAGEVVEVGSAVSGFLPGDRVVGDCVVGPGGRDHFEFNISGAAAELFKVKAEWLQQNSWVADVHAGGARGTVERCVQRGDLSSAASIQAIPSPSWAEVPSDSCPCSSPRQITPGWS